MQIVIKVPKSDLKALEKKFSFEKKESSYSLLFFRVLTNFSFIIKYSSWSHFHSHELVCKKKVMCYHYTPIFPFVKGLNICHWVLGNQFSKLIIFQQKYSFYLLLLLFKCWSHIFYECLLAFGCVMFGHSSFYDCQGWVFHLCFLFLIFQVKKKKKKPCTLF